MTHAAVHHSVTTIKRSAGQSATARVAYICRTHIYDERLGKTHRYNDHEDELGAVQMIGFDGSPEEFANTLEAAEKRKDAQVGRSSIIALPNELPPDIAARAVKRHQQWLLIEYGIRSLSAIHEKHSSETLNSNRHAHIIEDRRDLSGKIIRSLSNKATSAAEMERRRTAWAAIINDELTQHTPSSSTVDHRSLKRRAQAGDQQAIGKPTIPHLGPAQHAIRKKRTPSWATRLVRESKALLSLWHAFQKSSSTLTAVIKEDHHEALVVSLIEKRRQERAQNHQPTHELQR